MIFGKSPARPGPARKVHLFRGACRISVRGGGNILRGSASKGVREAEPPGHGRSRDFFRGGTLFEKNFKKFSKIFKKYSKIFKKYSKIYRKYSKKFRKFLKIFLRKLLKMPYFSIFFKKISNPCVKFLRRWTKNPICWRFLR